MPDQCLSQLPESVLVQRAQQDDLQAFNVLVERYETQAYNLARRMLGDPAAAEDATQDAFISAYQNIRRFRGEHLRPWLLKIVANASRDVLRSPERRRTVSLEEIAAAGDPPWPSKEESPEAYTLRQELGQEIQRGLQALPRDQRLVVILVDVQGLSYEEAALVTRASLGTVKSRLSRARANLRDYLRPKRELFSGVIRPDQ